MPWTCPSCGCAGVADTTIDCPGCGAGKTAWTVVEDRTRLFVVPTKKLTLQRGDSVLSHPPGDPQGATVVLREAEEAIALPRSEVRALFDRGHLPPSAYVTFVTLLHG